MESKSGIKLNIIKSGFKNMYLADYHMIND